MNSVTITEIKAKVAAQEVFRSDTLTIVVLTLDNGFKVVGKSACINPAHYDKGIGYRIAYDDAVDKVWELEGYHRLQVAFENTPKKNSESCTE